MLILIFKNIIKRKALLFNQKLRRNENFSPSQTLLDRLKRKWNLSITGENLPANKDYATDIVKRLKEMIEKEV